MKKNFLVSFALTVLLLASLVGAPPDASPGRQVITSTALRSAGLTRISDLLLLADNWYITTIDGYTWRAAVNGLNTYDDQAWTVFLDGQRIDLKTVDIINLNTLPVALEQIDSVEFFSSPQLHFGEFTDKGLIHIHTRRPQPGVSVAGHYYGGNETGDPGPHLYTRYHTPNVDRLGLDESLNLDIARADWSARFFLLWQSHSFSDFAMYRRAGSTGAGFPHLNLWSGFGRIRLNSARGEHELFASNIHGDKHRVFFGPLGREIPVVYRSPQIGLSGTVFFRPGSFNLQYRLRIARNTLSESANQLNFDYGYSLQTINAAILGKFRGSSFGGHVGVGFDHYLFDAHPDLTNPACMIGKLFGELDVNWMRIRSVLGAMILSSSDDVAFKASLTNIWPVNHRSRLVATIAISQRLVAEDNSLWYWVRQGYRLFEIHGVEYSLPGDWEKGGRLTADVLWARNLGNSLTATAAVFYRRLDGLYLERLSLQYEPDVCAFSSPASAVGGLNGAVGGLNLTLAISSERGPDHEAFYIYQTTLDGDREFFHAQEAIPEHKAGYRIAWVPFKNLAVWAMIGYRSAVVYPDYLDAGPQICQLGSGITPVYPPVLESTTFLDVAIKKWFWRRRITGQIILRNLTNQEVRYHPVGANFGLSMLVQVDALLNVAPQ